MGSQRSDEIEMQDMLSDLPDFILLHIMNFVKINEAIQTSVLSTRWKNLWKHLENLKLHPSYFPGVVPFREVISLILFFRDASTSLKNVSLEYNGNLGVDVLNNFIGYVVSHNIQNLTVDTRFLELPHCIWSCQSLTFLKLSNRNSINLKAIIPKSLSFPALKILHIANVSFGTCKNDHVDPFSTCKILDTLVIEDSFENNLCISNSVLTNLTIINSYTNDEEARNHKIVICTPKLTSVKVKGLLGRPVSSACDLLFLEEVNLDIRYRFRDFTKESLMLINWLQVFGNVATMKLSSTTLETINVLLFGRTIRTQLPHFAKLKSLKVELDSSARISSDKEVSRIAEYLLEKSPSAKLDIIRHPLLYR